MPRNVEFRPDVFKAAMIIIVDDFDSPSHRRSGDRDWRAFKRATLHRTNCSGFPLVLHVQPGAFDFPLLTTKYVISADPFPLLDL